MNLSRTERWTLSNQYKILEQLAELRKDDAEVEHCKDAQHVLSQGFVREYDDLAKGIYGDQETLSEEGCLEVFKILAMFDDLQRFYSQLQTTDRVGIAEPWTSFPGFHGNTEGKQLSYAMYFCRDPNTYKGLDRSNNFDSHLPESLNRYRKMMQELENSADRNNLTKEDLIRITNVK